MGRGIPQVTCNQQRFFLFRVSERSKVEKREAGDWNETGEEEGKASRQMLNGACKYRERRDTKGAPKRSGVRAQANRRGTGRGWRGAMYAVGSSCTGPEGWRAWCTLQEKENRKRAGGSSTKGCFNSLLSSVAEQEEKKK